jgi:hypothetical protein
MFHKTVLQIGGVAAVLGAFIALVFNLLYPRSDDLSALGYANLALEGGRWQLVHYMIAWAIALVLIGLVAVARSLTTQPSVSWGRLATYSLVGSTGLLLIALMLSGYALPAAGNAGGSEEVLAAVSHVGAGVFLASIGAYFGITPLLYGIAVVTGDDYPAWLGWAAVLAGLLALVTASIMFFQAEQTTLTANVLFPIASVIYTVWAGVMGVLLWQKATTIAEPQHGAANV